MQALGTVGAILARDSKAGVIRGCSLFCVSLIVAAVSMTVVPLHALAPEKLISQFTHTAWSAQDGIPVPVHAVVQTLDGYLWLGTEAGLYRFDGLHFLAWEPTSGEHLLSDSVFALYVARDGRLWIGYGSGGIGVLENYRLQNFVAGQDIPGGGILSITEDRDGAIWACGQYGFSKYTNGVWHPVGKEMGYPAPGAQSLLVDREGNLWVATDGMDFGLNRDPVRRNTILTLPPGAARFAPTGLGIGMVWSFSEAPDGSVWIADTTGFAARRITGPTRGLATISADDKPTCLVFDSDHAAWIGTLSDVQRLTTDFARPREAPQDRIRRVDGLSGGFVYSTFRDREGNLWFGTSGGLDRFSKKKFVTFSAREGLEPDQLAAVSSTADGSLWVIAYSHDRVWRLQEKRSWTSEIRAPEPTGVGDILSIFADGKNDVWLGGNSELAMGRDGKFSRLQIPSAAKGAYIEAVAKDRAGSLWIALRSKQGSEHIMRFLDGSWDDLSATGKLPKYRCRVMYSDQAGRMWLGFENGEVAMFEGGAFRLYSFRDGLPAEVVLVITADTQRHIWIGGYGGLSRFENGHFSTITKQSGLPGNSVSGFVEDEDGYFWIAGSLGILRVSEEELAKALASSSYRMRGTSFDASDGLRGLPRQREPVPMATRTADGWLWFATTEGIAAINPHDIPRNLVPPPVVIETVRSDDQAFVASSGVQFHPNTRNMEFHFTALSFTDPARVQFRYKLDGYDDSWRGPVSIREARYTNLPPRSYTFRVLACNNDGVWNEVGASLDLDIPPAWYQTLSFRALCAVAFFLLLWVGYLHRVRNLKAQERKLRDVIETIPTFAWTALPDGSVDFVNRHWREYTGLSTEKTVGSGWQSAVHVQDLERHTAKWHASLTTGRPFESEVRYRCAADAEYRWFLTRAVPLQDDNGRIVKWYGIANDIEDRKRAEQLQSELAHVNRVSTMGELVASISHELKQPITAAIVHANTVLQWLRRDPPNVSQADQVASKITEDGTRASEIIDRLRSLYKKSPPKREPIAVNEVIGEMVGMLRAEATRHAVSIRADLVGDLPPVRADLVQIQQVLMNLMLNGIEAMHETGGVLTVKSQRRADGQIEISVNDTGPGLPPDKSERIFDAFVTTKPQGSGMGLAISKSILESHGGRIWANGNDGRGATFRFTLPSESTTSSTLAD